MGDEYETLQAIGVFFVCWGTVFFGVWVLPTGDSLKVAVDVSSSISFVIFGILYFRKKGMIPTPKREIIEKVMFWFVSIGFLFTAGFSFYLNVLAWNIVTIGGVQVVTYQDLYSLLFGAVGILSLVRLFNIVTKRNPYKRHKKPRQQKTLP